MNVVYQSCMKNALLASDTTGIRADLCTGHPGPFTFHPGPVIIPHLVVVHFADDESSFEHSVCVHACVCVHGIM